MPPKIIPTTATTLGSVSDINITDTDSQVVIMGQLYKVVN
jgi:hypothetical protein